MPVCWVSLKIHCPKLVRIPGNSSGVAKENSNEPSQQIDQSLQNSEKESLSSEEEVGETVLVTSTMTGKEFTIRRSKVANLTAVNYVSHSQFDPTLPDTPILLRKKTSQFEEDLIRPAFTQKLKPATIETDDTAEFICRFIAAPRPEIIWFHNDKTIKNGGRHQTSSERDMFSYIAVLEVKDCVASDAGTYKVTVRNKEGECQSTAELEITHHTNGLRVPKLNLTILTEDEQRKSKVIGSARIPFSPKRYLDRVRGRESRAQSLREDFRRTRSFESSLNGSRRSTLSAEGHHFRALSLNNIINGRNLSLRGRRANSMSSGGDDQTVHPASDSETCSLATSTSTMRQPNHTSSNLSGYLTGRSRYSDETRSFSLELPDFADTASDIVTHSTASTSGVFMMDDSMESRRSSISGRKEAPVIVEPLPDSIKLASGTELLLVCKVTGKPRPKPVWLKNTIMIPDHSKPYAFLESETSGPGYTFSLLVKNASIKESGVYTFSALNVAGDVSCTSKVVVTLSQDNKRPHVGYGKAIKHGDDCVKTLTTSKEHIPAGLNFTPHHGTKLRNGDHETWRDSHLVGVYKHDISAGNTSVSRLAQRSRSAHRNKLERQATDPSFKSSAFITLSRNDSHGKSSGRRFTRALSFDSRFQSSEVLLENKVNSGNDRCDRFGKKNTRPAYRRHSLPVNYAYVCRSPPPALRVFEKVFPHPDLIWQQARCILHAVAQEKHEKATVRPHSEVFADDTRADRHYRQENLSPDSTNENLYSDFETQGSYPSFSYPLPDPGYEDLQTDSTSISGSLWSSSTPTNSDITDGVKPDFPGADISGLNTSPHEIFSQYITKTEPETQNETISTEQSVGSLHCEVFQDQLNQNIKAECRGSSTPRDDTKEQVQRPFANYFDLVANLPQNASPASAVSSDPAILESGHTEESNHIIAEAMELCSEVNATLGNLKEILGIEVSLEEIPEIAKRFLNQETDASQFYRLDIEENREFDDKCKSLATHARDTLGSHHLTSNCELEGAKFEMDHAESNGAQDNIMRTDSPDACSGKWTPASNESDGKTDSPLMADYCLSSDEEAEMNTGRAEIDICQSPCSTIDESTHQISNDYDDLLNAEISRVTGFVSPSDSSISHDHRDPTRINSEATCTTARVPSIHFEPVNSRVDVYEKFSQRDETTEEFKRSPACEISRPNEEKIVQPPKNGEFQRLLDATQEPLSSSLSPIPEESGDLEETCQGQSHRNVVPESSKSEEDEPIFDLDDIEYHAPTPKDLSPIFEVDEFEYTDDEYHSSVDDFASKVQIVVNAENDVVDSADSLASFEAHEKTLLRGESGPSNYSDCKSNITGRQRGKLTPNHSFDEDITHRAFLGRPLVFRNGTLSRNSSIDSEYHSSSETVEKMPETSTSDRDSVTPRCSDSSLGAEHGKGDEIGIEPLACNVLIPKVIQPDNVGYSLKKLHRDWSRDSGTTIDDESDHSDDVVDATAIAILDSDYCNDIGIFERETDDVDVQSMTSSVESFTSVWRSDYDQSDDVFLDDREDTLSITTASDVTMDYMSCHSDDIDSEGGFKTPTGRGTANSDFATPVGRRSYDDSDNDSDRTVTPDDSNDSKKDSSDFTSGKPSGKGFSTPPTFKVVIPPKFIGLKMDKLHVKEGKTAKLKCSLVSYPSAKVAWYKDGRLLEIYGRISHHIVTVEESGINPSWRPPCTVANLDSEILRSDLDVHYILKIEDTKKSDQGVYICKAWSTAGVATKIIRIGVNGHTEK